MREDSTQTFKISKSARGVFLFGLLFFTTGLLVCILLPVFEPIILRIKWIWLVVTLGYVFFVALFYIAWRHRNDYVQANNNKISYFYYDGRQVHIRWDELSRIRERVFCERLVLHNISGEKSINLEYQLENFDQLRAIILRNSGYLFEEYRHMNRFYRRLYVHFFFSLILIFVAFLAVSSFVVGQIFEAICFTFFTLILVLAVLKEPWKLGIDKDHIEILYPLWKRKLAFSELTDIAIENVKGGRSAEVVLLKRKRGKPVKLGWFKEGAIALYTALKAWEETQRTVAQAIQ